MNTFQGKVAVVTGGASGMGLATAKKLVQAGAHVVIAGRNAERGEVAQQTLRAICPTVRFVQTDVTQPDQVERLMQTALETFGGLDLAFNNAGVEAMAPLDYLSEELWDQVLNINLKGMWLSMKYEIAHMAQNGGGVIVNNSSTAGAKGMVAAAAYVASKHGVNGLTKALALECAEAGIRINAIMPGPIETPMLERISSLLPNPDEMLPSLTAMRRTGKPDEVADAVLWLLSDASSYVTGTVIPVDGGMLAL